MRKEIVLLLDGQAVQALVCARFLSKSGYEVYALCDGKVNYGYHSRYVSRRFVHEQTNYKDKYREFVLELLTRYPVDVVIPMTDETALFLSKYQEEIKKYTHVLIPEYDVFMAGYDKNRLMALCKKNGYPHPETVDLSIEDYQRSSIVQSFQYSALLKPNFTTGGRGMVRIDNYQHLLEVYPQIKAIYGDCHLQRYIRQGGKQMKVELFVDAQQRLQYSSVIHKQRFYPVNGGSSCCNVTVNNPELVKLCAAVLHDIGWIGFADFDLIEDPDTHEFLIMEINPRIPACIKSAFMSGIDYATIIADASLGKTLQKYEYKAGKHLRHLGFEVLWFFNSPQRFSARPSWFNFWGKDIFYQDLSWSDISPFIFGTWGNLMKQLNPEFRKSKAGLQ